MFAHSIAMYVSKMNQNARNPRSLPPTRFWKVYSPPALGDLQIMACRFQVITRITNMPTSRPKTVPKMPDFCR